MTGHAAHHIQVRSRRGGVSLVALRSLVVLVALSVGIAAPSGRADAQTAYTAVQDGVWNDPATWGGPFPGLTLESASVEIASGITVTIPVGLNVPLGEASTVLVRGGLDVRGHLAMGADSLLRNRGLLTVGGAGSLDLQANPEGDLWNQGRLVNEGTTLVGLLENGPSGTVDNTGYIQASRLENGDPGVRSRGGSIVNDGSMFLTSSVIRGRAGHFNLGTFTNGEDGTLRFNGKFANWPCGDCRTVFRNIGEVVGQSGSTFRNTAALANQGHLEADWVSQSDDITFDGRFVIRGHEASFTNFGTVGGDSLSFEDGSLVNAFSGEIQPRERLTIDIQTARDHGAISVDAGVSLVVRESAVFEAFGRIENAGSVTNAGTMAVGGTIATRSGGSVANEGRLGVTCDGDLNFEPLGWYVGTPSEDWCDTPPAVTTVVDGEEGENDWYVSDVLVSWTWEEAGSPITGFSDCGAVRVSTSGPFEKTCSVTSYGGTTSSTADIRLDLDLPVVEGVEVTPTANAAGWHRQPVELAFVGADRTSGIAGCDTDTLAGEGEDLSAEGTCTDLAGNVSDPLAVDGINIDLTEPVVGFDGLAASYLLSDPVSIDCVASDALSGLDSVDCSGASGFGYEFDHTATNGVTASASDVAGNMANADGSFEVVVTRAGIDFVIDRYVADTRLALALKQELDKITAADSKKKPKDKTEKKAGGFEETVDAGVANGDLSEEQGDHLIALVDSLYLTEA